MTPDLILLLNDAIRVALYVGLFGALIFALYILDLRLCPKRLQVEGGAGPRRRSSARLEVVDRDQNS